MFHKRLQLSFNLVQVAGTNTSCGAPEKILFASNRGEGGGTYVMNADGTNQTQLTGNYGVNTPSWSPDGTKVAYSNLDDIGDTSGIYSVNADGTNKTRLTASSYDNEPTWSPDGTKIAYDSSTDSNDGRLDERTGPRIYVINADGTNPTRLTDDNNSDNSPRWSPAQSKTIASNSVNVTVSNNGIFLSVHIGNQSSIPTTGPCHEFNNIPSKILVRIDQSQ